MEKEVIRVNKRKAKRLYDEGKAVYVVPCKVECDFNNPNFKPFEISHNEFGDRSFNEIIDDYIYWSCNSFIGLGLHPHYYIEK